MPPGFALQSLAFADLDGWPADDHAAALLAFRRGAAVIATVSTAEKAELARGAGAQEVIRYTEQDFVAEVKRITGGKGV